MTTTNMRKGFTMIELIFVIVIIGILAAVAIPKLAANRTDAQAAVCVHEAGQLVTEISAVYTAKGFSGFETLELAKMTNIVSGTVALNDGNFIIDNIVHGLTTAQYVCDDEPIMTFGGVVDTSTGDYNLTVTEVNATTSPAAIKAGNILRRNGIHKIYAL